ncbi:MAG: class IV adenylate cyclase [Candidatus Methanoperedens sp.]|nr:class IV adenylate cyclase [Candidatus Methanoperedens sp.]MCZ7370794.1 class IV adenylate cyclase [Candidatus Methanoperedens sp.]
MIEVEVKAYVDDPKHLERSIIALGAAPIGIETQADTYYNAPYRDFGKTDEALRIRVKGSEYFLTYKGPKMDKISKTRKEFEVGIKGGHNMGEILTSLGFCPVATIVKKRKNYRLGEFFIALDEVRNLGNFIEIEISAMKSKNHEEKVESIFRLLEKLNISRESTIRKSYLEMVLESGKDGNCSSVIE